MCRFSMVRTCSNIEKARTHRLFGFQMTKPHSVLDSAIAGYPTRINFTVGHRLMDMRTDVNAVPLAGLGLKNLRKRGK